MKWEGLGFFQEFESLTGHTADFRATGYLAVAGQTQAEALMTDLESLRKHGSLAELSTGIEVQRHYKALQINDEEVGLFLPEPGYADPVQATQALAASARSRGTKVYEFTSVRKICTAHGSISGVITDRGEVSAGAVVLACGVWSNQLLADVGIRLPIYWHRAEVCCYRRPASVAEHPIIADFTQRCYFRPEIGGLTLIGNIPVMRSGTATPADLEDVADPGHIRQEIGATTIQQLQSKLSARVPALKEAYWRRGHACVYDVTPDWHPIIDVSEKVKGLFVAAGFSGHGFVMSPAIGRVIAEAVLGGKRDGEIERLLRAERFEQHEPVLFEVG
jgi:glycine/D-amino acid oxidase-like deaminating enzyme